MSYCIYATHRRQPVAVFDPTLAHGTSTSVKGRFDTAAAMNGAVKTDARTGFAESGVEHRHDGHTEVEIPAAVHTR